MTDTGPSGRDRRLRLGIMCSGIAFPAWQAAAIRKLIEVPGVEVTLLIVDDAPRHSLIAKFGRLRNPRLLLWTLFNKGFVERRSRASASVDLSTELGHAAQLRCHTTPVGKYAEAFQDDDLETIREYDLDVILRFAFGVIKGRILTLPRYGVWSFHHGDERRYRGRPPAFWELAEGEKVVGSILQRLTERLDGGVVLHRGYFKITPHSYLRTRDEAFLGSADWPSVVCRQVLAGDLSSVEAEPSSTGARVRRDPANRDTARFLLRQGLAFLRSQWRGLTKAARWSVGVAGAPISSFLHGAEPAIRWVLEPGNTRYLADPFVVDYEGSLVALVEDYDYRTRRGVISALRLDEPNPVPRAVLDTGCHASYPYLFWANGAIWCTPETYQAEEVRLYRARDFPDSWELVTRLVKDAAALDPTLVQHGGRWWLFFTDHRTGPNTKLYVWYADELTGTWLPHGLNPVKTDVRSARPAGTPFTLNGVLYRPAQDASDNYGARVVINRVDILTPTGFSETPVAVVPPPRQGRYRDGLHTLCAAGEMTVIDGRRDTFIPAAFRGELASRLAKLVSRPVTGVGEPAGRTPK